MAERSTSGKLLAEPPAIRCGRPPRELAGEVEERILEAAGKVFLERGFEGASIDEIAGVARAGKPTIYAQFHSKEVLFTAVMDRKLRQSISAEEIAAATGSTTEERLTSIATAILETVLVADAIGLARSAIAEARRFPDLATGVGRMARERRTEALVRELSELAKSDELRGLPAFAPDRLTATARHFLDLVLMSMLLRALFGEDLAALRADIKPNVARAVAFFLAGCREVAVGRAPDQATDQSCSRVR